MLHGENRRVPTPPDASSKPAWETSDRPTSEQISKMWYSHSYPWDKPEEPPGQTDPHHHPAKKKAE
jgi:hypothetical protein